MGQIYSVRVVSSGGESGWIVDRNRSGSDNPIGPQIHRASFNSRDAAESAAKALAGKIRYHEVIPMWTESDLPVIG
jgi:hypothetical protein